MNSKSPNESALDRARQKAYWRLLPLLFICYVIAYVDRANVAIAKLTMSKALPDFDNAVIGFGAGMFFVGYFLLEIPGSIIVEKWSARKWICRIMITWGIFAALTAFVTTPFQFYLVRFLLGLAEAGFFPGVIVYLTHWFPARDRSRALAWFFVAMPAALIVSPKISNALIKIGTNEMASGSLVPLLPPGMTVSEAAAAANAVVAHHPLVLGLQGWQWIYIFWGVPAVILGFVVLFALTDRPRDAKWLEPAEREALERVLADEKAKRAAGRRMTLVDAFRHPKVLLLTAAYFCTVSASLGLELFLPTILDTWYKLKMNSITWLVMLPPGLALVGQLFVGWNSDRTKERRWHTIVPVSLSLIALSLAPLTQGHLMLTVICFMVIAAGLKAYLPAFWSLPSVFLTETAAAGSIGLINSVGNLGAFYGQTLLGQIQKTTGSFVGGFYYLCGSMAVFIVIIYLLGLGRRESRA